MMPDQSVREALAEYFEHNGFDADGGYDKTWVGLLVLWPRATIKAWQAGRASCSLYRYDFDEWMLELSTDELHRMILLD